MHDYVRGAFEALSWVQRLVQDFDSKKDPAAHVDRLNKEVEAAIGDIKMGIAEDFRWKLKG